MNVTKSMSVTIAGECMVTRPFSAGREPEFLSVMERLRSSDVTYAHIETNFGEYHEVRAPARSDSLGSYFLTDPRVAADLRWAGVEIASLANNHSFDFGAPGILTTIEHTERAGIAHAGTGRDLEEAREPAYLEVPRGRVALVSVSSGNAAHEWATLPKATLAGRVGLNPLRTMGKYVIDEESAQQLKAIWGKLGFTVRDGGRVGFSGRTLDTEAGEFVLPTPGDTWSTSRFVASDHFDVTVTLNEADLRANLRSIDEATAMADLVLVAHHFSNAEGSRGDDPPRFVRRFAHAAIDQGADIYIGHGWHRTLGIEIYKGRPIFYGVGNFFAQSEFARRVPYDGYEAWGHDVERLGTLNPAAHPLHPGHAAHSDTWWSSAVIELDLSDGQLREVRLHPVETGREVGGEVALRRPIGSGKNPLTDGRPFAATGTDAERVLDRYARLSRDLGTEVVIRDGVGVITL